MILSLLLPKSTAVTTGGQACAQVGCSQNLHQEHDSVYANT
jgi:hypothetical protein